MTKGKIFFWSCLAFIVGIFISSFVNLPPVLLVAVFLFGLTSFCLFWVDRRLVFLGLLVLALALGVFRYQLEADRIFKSELGKFNDGQDSIGITGVIEDDPQAKEKSQQFQIRVEKEKVLVIAPKYPSYHYGDKIKITGQLKTPENFEGFNYQGYLQKERVYSIMIFPRIELLASEQGNPVRQNLFNFKNKFQETWRRLLSPPHLGIFEALAFGEENNIPAEWKEKLNLSGTRHLAAVSGMNITIISFLLSGFLLTLGFWRPQASLISLVFIWFYILMIGAPASALRAGLMVSLFFLARGFGRVAAGERSLVFAAVILLWENPLILKFDVGFQLSFLAMAGLIYWSSFFKEKVFKKLPEFLRVNLATTLAAQVFTLPVLIYNFDYVSLISPLTNLLLVPLIPYLTMAGFVFGALGIVSFSLGQVLAWFVWLGTSYILLVVDWSLKIPGSHFVFRGVAGPFLAISYLFLGYFTWRIREKPGPKFLSF
ncbi:MAG: ComEC/Rec2 family competence protein [bacterium]|nr:ComEC/Rec2 family competence protein [bacterium]